VKFNKQQINQALVQAGGYGIKVQFEVSKTLTKKFGAKKEYTKEQVNDALVAYGIASPMVCLDVQKALNKIGGSK